MDNEDDIADTLSALPDAKASSDDDADIAKTLSSLDTPETKSASGTGNSHASLQTLPFSEKVARVESGGNPFAHAAGSSATGLGQFINSTWTQLLRKHRPDIAKGKTDGQLLSMRTDPALSSQMIDAYGNDNAESLQKNGIPVNDASKYGAHWFGADNFSKIFHADPSTPIENIVGREAANNNGLTGKTADQVKTLTANKMGMDYMPQDMSWSDTLSQAGSNLLPSVGHMAMGVYEAVRHPLDTASTLGSIAKGLDSKIEGWAGRDQDPQQKANDEALVDALANSYKEKYGTIDGFKQYLAHDPAGVVFDASTVLTAGGGLAAKLPGVLGKAGEIAGTVGKAMNPLNPLGAVSGTVKAAVTPTAVIDKAGNVVPKVDSLIKKVTKNGMSGADLADPEAKAQFVSSLSKKGVNEATVREALLKSLGLKTPTSVVTGVATPTSALPEVNKVIASNNELLAAHAAKIGAAPSTSELGGALDTAHAQSLNAASNAYDKIRSMPGSFGARMPEMGKLGSLIKQNFQKSGIPTADISSIVQTGHAQAAAAIKLLQNYWGSGRSLLNNGKGPINAPEILAMRKALNNLRSSAQGSDLKAVGDVTDAFDQHITNLSNRGLFVDQNGRPLQNVGKQIQAANTAYRTHFNTFETSNGANNSVVNAVKKLKSGQGRDAAGNVMPSGDSDLYTQAQSTLGKDLLHPAKGPATYNILSKALGNNTTPLNEYIKGSMVNPETKNAGALLNSPISAKAFAGSPDDLARARHVQAANVLNNSKPTLDAKAHSLLSEIAGRTLWKGLAGLAGEHWAGPVGAVLGPTVVEPTMEKLGEGKMLKKALAGAPNTMSLPRRAINAMARRAVSPTGLAAAHYEDEAKQANKSVISRAAGGKVDIDSLVDRLMKRWKQAKQATDKTTEPLLNVPDAAIVKALDIAQEHL